MKWKRNGAKGVELKAALLSGNPGIGKTSAALLVSRECGFEPIEFNASDVRNKASIQQYISQMTGNRSLGEFFSAESDNNNNNNNNNSSKKKVCLIMDEVDGMSAGDRGGMAELIQVVKNSKIPIVCICNDRSSPKVKSLANYTLDLRFRRPTAQQSLKRVTDIIQKEGFYSDTDSLTKVLESVQGDIRQVLNVLQMWRRNSNSLKKTDPRMQEKLFAAGKNIDYGPFDVLPKFFSPSGGSLTEKIALYFTDSSLVPLLVQENYIHTSPYRIINNSNINNNNNNNNNRQDPSLTHLELLSNAADSISESDLLNVMIHRGQHWELSSEHAVLSTIRPSSIMSGNTGRINFPSWLGKQSTTNKKYRLLREIQTHMGPVISADKTEVRLQYMPLLKQMLIDPILTKGAVSNLYIHLSMLSLLYHYYLR